MKAIKEKKVKLKKRFFLLSSAILFTNLSLNLQAKDKKTKNLFLRPPGALTPKEFLSSCIKCGQCVQVCPYYCLKIADITDGFGIATPYINANERGCYLCDLFPCVLSCPSGALSHDTTLVSDVKMGVAVITELNSCLSFKKKRLKQSDVLNLISYKTHNQKEKDVVEKIKSKVGEKCDLCASLCPHPKSFKAIEMINLDDKKAPLIKEACVGCGVCAEVCPAQIIEIVPQATYSKIYGDNI
ncbi:4Fe-4S dicluster domain-containing protein [Campylobacter geochelonis]|uniref:4Fe-4S dicluster domain-containing protein n=1 Tax=Campylobacter geochelonis TaxID=1780362 RepID=UPI0007707999|nr:4Fe-4S dicluster domain-containing protein [Campylobacter geochelonis]CZE46027.1 iron-sulfur protein [Campylobacter geochelonis]